MAWGSRQDKGREPADDTGKRVLGPEEEHHSDRPCFGNSQVGVENKESNLQVE